MTDHRQTFPPVFATNDGDTGETVAEAVTRLFLKSREELKVPPAIAIATAYLNPGGFLAIADEVEKAPHVRILLGADPQEDVVESVQLGTADHEKRLHSALQHHSKWLEEERDLLGFTRESSEAAKRLVAWLRHAAETGEPIVEVRKYSKGFLHGKAFIVDHEAFPAVLAGSSNLTYAGLNRNAELNLGYSTGDRGHTKLVQEWFEKYWNEAEDFDLAELYEARWQEHSPWIVFLRMLWEQYKDHLDDETLDPTTELKLTKFQSDGVKRMLRLLDTHGGVLVADEVGLGKTFLAGEVIAQASERDRQRVLIVCPASLRDSMWNKFLDQYGLSRRISVMSYEELRNKMDPEDPDYQQFMNVLDDYSLVVIDEAHNLRNESAARSKAVDALVGGANPKKTILLTATPVNNSLSDLETLIRYFIRSDSYFAEIGIPSIKKYIDRAQSIDPDSLSPRMLFDLMDQVAVRRTRKFVKDNYPHDRIKLPSGEETTIVFPTPKVYRIDYTLDQQGEDLLDKVAAALEVQDDNGRIIRKDNPDRLLLSRYTPSGYRKDNEIVEYQVSNAQLLRSSLLKRLESSPRALHSTLSVMIKSHQDFLKGLSEGWVLSGDALREYANSDSEDLDELLENFDERKKSQVDTASDYVVDELKADVERDLNLLEEVRELAWSAASATEPKVEELVDQLRAIATDARRVSKDGLSDTDRRKVIVFSAYADTVQDVHNRLESAINIAPDSDPLSDYRGRLPEAIAGRGDRVRRSEILANFAPRTAGDVRENGDPYSEDKYDILVTTDVLAEGVNLQQAGRMINYDLPWNPMRIVQRHGRIDRIGSQHANVHLGCFFPDQKLDKLLRLEGTLQRKLAYAAASVGVTEVIPGQKSVVDSSFIDSMKIEADLDENEAEIRKLYEENADLLETRGEGSALSGEEYRRRLSNAMAETFTKPEVLKLPYASGSGFMNPNVSQSGFVWCMKMGHHEKAWFAFTPVDENWRVLQDVETGEYAVDRDVLTSLIAADPGGPEMFRELPEAVFNAAYDAWLVAQDATFKNWDKLTDPRALMPELTPTMKRAMDFVRNYHGDELSVEEKQHLLAQLNTTPKQVTRREINEILNSEFSDQQKLRKLLEVVESAGLTPAKSAKGLSRITKDEVRLIAWMAVKAGK